MYVRSEAYAARRSSGELSFLTSPTLSPKKVYTRPIHSESRVAKYWFTVTTCTPLPNPPAPRVRANVSPPERIGRASRPGGWRPGSCPRRYASPRSSPRTSRSRRSLGSHSVACPAPGERPRASAVPIGLFASSTRYREPCSAAASLISTQGGGLVHGSVPVLLERGFVLVAPAEDTSEERAPRPRRCCQRSRRRGCHAQLLHAGPLRLALSLLGLLAVATALALAVGALIAADAAAIDGSLLGGRVRGPRIAVGVARVPGPILSERRGGRLVEGDGTSPSSSASKRVALSPLLLAPFSSPTVAPDSSRASLPPPLLLLPLLLRLTALAQTTPRHARCWGARNRRWWQPWRRTRRTRRAATTASAAARDRPCNSDTRWVAHGAARVSIAADLGVDGLVRASE
eukprot:scaffold488_cov372-Prasinococcus_capsulatus_cf.AAC.6